MAKVRKRRRDGTEGAYVHVALSVVVEAEQHQAVLSAIADAPETPQIAVPPPRPRNFPDFPSIFLRTWFTTPPRVEPVTKRFFKIISYFFWDGISKAKCQAL